MSNFSSITVLSISVVLFLFDFGCFAKENMNQNINNEQNNGSSCKSKTKAECKQDINCVPIFGPSYCMDGPNGNCSADIQYKGCKNLPVEEANLKNNFKDNCIENKGVFLNDDHEGSCKCPDGLLEVRLFGCATFDKSCAMIGGTILKAGLPCPGPSNKLGPYCDNKILIKDICSCKYGASYRDSKKVLVDYLKPGDVLFAFDMRIKCKEN